LSLGKGFVSGYRNAYVIGALENVVGEAIGLETHRMAESLEGTRHMGAIFGISHVVGPFAKKLLKSEIAAGMIGNGLTRTFELILIQKPYISSEIRREMVTITLSMQSKVSPFRIWVPRSSVIIASRNSPKMILINILASCVIHISAIYAKPSSVQQSLGLPISPEALINTNAIVA